MRNCEFSIDNARALALSRGGKCLSDKYVNSITKMLWECDKGHTWEASLCSVKRRSWCPICAKNKTYTIDLIQEIVRLRGGNCLSTEYINSDEKLLWECDKGHQWQASWVRINNKKQSWCPICSKKNKSQTNKPLTLD